MSILLELLREALLSHSLKQQSIECSGLCSWGKIVRLSLSHCNVGDAGVVHIAGAMMGSWQGPETDTQKRAGIGRTTSLSREARTTNPLLVSLTDLNLSHCGVGGVGVMALAEAFGRGYSGVTKVPGDCGGKAFHSSSSSSSSSSSIGSPSSLPLPIPAPIPLRLVPLALVPLTEM